MHQRGHEGVLGREAELAAIDRLIAEARDGQSSVLVLEGEPGIGKTELMRYAAAQATGFTRLGVRGFEAESEPAFAYIADIVRPLTGLLDRLTPNQSAALQTAIGASGVAVPAAAGDRFVIYAAILSLIALAAESGPVLLTIDDAHWLDAPSADALVFVARRLDREGVVALFGVRGEEPGADLFTTLPALKLRGLDREATAALFNLSTSQRASGVQVDRVYEATKGNPLAVRELGRTVTEEGVEIETALAAPISFGPIVESAFRRRVDRLPERVRSALIVAASSDSGHMSEISSVLRRLELDTRDLEPSEEIALVRVHQGVLEFEHPVVRTVVYQAAPPALRRKVHAAFADALSEGEDLERRAWHLAQSAVEPSESIAQIVETAANRALERSGFWSSAALYKLSAALSPERRSSVERLLKAGKTAQLAGRPEEAERILKEALSRTDDFALRADIEQTRARVYMWWQAPMRAHEILVRQAEQIATADPVRAAYLLAEAAGPCFMAAKLDLALKTAERSVRLISSLSGEAAAMADAIRAEALMLLGRIKEAVPLLDSSLAVMDREPSLLMHPVVNFLTQVELAAERYEDARTHVERIVDTGRRLGALGMLPYNIAVGSELEFRTGNWPQAYALAGEAVRLAQETGQESVCAYALATLSRVEAATGHQEARDHVALALRLMEKHGVNSIHTYCFAALGLLELGLGKLGPAAAALDQVAVGVAANGLAEPSVVQWQPDHVEALARTGRHAEAEDALEVLDRQASETGGRWALATAQRCHGVLAHAQQDEFASCFDRALELADPRWHHFEIARTHLCYGEALRRTKQHTRAREHLRVALTEFARLGAKPWEEKARSELLAAGDRTTPRLATSGAELSPQELQVALAVAQGLTNREVADRLFLSTKTIESHLARVYSKLGVRSRSQLVRHFATRESSLPA